MNTQRRLLEYLRPFRKILVAGLICAGITSAIEAVVALFIKEVINSMTSGQVGHLNFMCAAVILVFIIKGIFTFGQNYFLSLTANSMVARMRDNIFEHLHSLSLSYFNQKRTGAILSVLTNDVPVIQDAAMNLRQMISAPLTIVISLAMLFRFSWFLALVSLVFIPFMAVAIQRISRRIGRISRAVQGKLSDVTHIVEETVAGARVVKSFAAEKHEIERFRDENARTLQTVMRGERRRAQLRPVIDFIGAFGIALVMYLGGNMVAATVYLRRAGAAGIYGHNPVPFFLRQFVVHHGLTVGAFTAFLFLLDRVARSASQVGSIATTRQQALAAAGHIFEEVLDVVPDVQESANARPMPEIKGGITFQNVSFRYSPEGPLVLQNISLQVEPGEIVALVGRSGAGKSTLADLIPRFYDPVEGKVSIDSVDLREVKLGSLRSQIGIVPQETRLFAGTLRDNVAYGNRSATDAEIWQALQQANASFVQGFEEQLDTMVGDRGVRLSGGERQRIAIARAILMNPRLLILDEATSSLDASSEALVQEALEHLMRGRTTLIIAHRLSTIVGAHRIVAMQDGRIVETGSHRELIEAGGYYANLYETQLSGFE